MIKEDFMAGMNLAAANQPIKRWKSQEPGKLIEWFKDTVDHLFEEVDEKPNEMVDWAKEWYDKIIRPIDLPYVLNIGVEPIVDDLIWKAIEFGLRKYLPDVPEFPFISSLFDKVFEFVQQYLLPAKS
jgi:hypothetical protein